MSKFAANCLPLLIGSLPVTSHAEATELIFQYSPAIPLWPQLPIFKAEGMINQFLPGMPGITEVDGRVCINTSNDDFSEALVGFYEEYLLVSEGGGAIDESRFSLGRDVAQGFYTFLDVARVNQAGLAALKGQITGPITFCTGLVDENGRAIFYNEQVRDAAVKHLALKARWQVKKMREVCATAIMFFDEPGLAGLGSSALITITEESILACFNEVFSAVRAEGGLTGIHVCANTEWPVIFASGVDIVSFDAYAFFDKLVLYPQHLKEFFDRGGILASGIVPTTPELIDNAESEALTKKWFEQAEKLQEIGIKKETIKTQTLITPSCGTGTVSNSQAEKVLHLTRTVSENIRASFP